MQYSDVVLLSLFACIVHSNVFPELQEDMLITIYIMTAYKVGGESPWVYFLAAMFVRFPIFHPERFPVKDPAHVIGIYFMGTCFLEWMGSRLFDQNGRFRGRAVVSEAELASQYVPRKAGSTVCDGKTACDGKTFSIENKADSFLANALEHLDGEELSKLANQLVAILYKANDHVKMEEEEEEEEEEEDEEEDEVGARMKSKDA